MEILIFVAGYFLGSWVSILLVMQGFLNRMNKRDLL